MVWSATFLAFKHVQSLVVFARGLQLVSRPSVFTVFDLYQVYLPLIGFEIVALRNSP